MIRESMFIPTHLKKVKVERQTTQERLTSIDSGPMSLATHCIKSYAFAFAPWDTTGKTIAVGFSNGQALLITNAFDYMTPTAKSISLSPNAKEVTALSFSHPDRDDYGVRASEAFISISHDEKKYPQITRFINGQPTLDTDFASNPNGVSNDNLIVGSNKIYVATNEVFIKEEWRAVIIWNK